MKMENNVAGLLHINKPLVPLKLMLFLYIGTKATLQAFLGIYLRQIGLNLKEITMIFTVTSIFQFIGIGVSGIVVEKTGKLKTILSVNLWVSLVSANLFLILPYSKNSFLPSSELASLCPKYLVNGTSDDSTNDRVSHILNIDFGNCTSLSHNISIHSLEHFCSSSNTTLCVTEKYTSIQQVLPAWCCHDVEFNKYFKTCTNICNVSSTFFPSEDNNVNDNRLFFILTMIFTIAFKTSTQIVAAYMDYTAVFMSKQYNSDFGRQRLWWSLGTIFMPALSGWIVGIFESKVDASYSASFIIYDVVAVITLFIIYKLDIESPSEKSGLGKRVLQLFKSIDIAILIFIVLIFSINFGFKKEFIPIYLDQLKASSLVIGLMTAMYGLAGLPFLYISDWWVNKIGSENLLVCAFFSYGLYFVGYCYVTNPWWFILLEAASVTNNHMMWVSVVRRNREVTTEELRAPAQSLLHTINFGFSRLSGCVIGGFVMSAFGGPVTFWVLAVMSFISGILYISYKSARRLWIAGQQTYDVKSTSAGEKGERVVKKTEIYTITKVE